MLVHAQLGDGGGRRHGAGGQVATSDARRRWLRKRSGAVAVRAGGTSPRGGQQPGRVRRWGAGWQRGAAALQRGGSVGINSGRLSRAASGAVSRQSSGGSFAGMPGRPPTGLPPTPSSARRNPMLARLMSADTLAVSASSFAVLQWAHCCVSTAHLLPWCWEMLGGRGQPSSPTFSR